jgi:DNA-binding CsgD family transcriptional regulator
MSHAVRLAIEGKDIEIFALDHIESPLLTGREFDVLKLLSYGAKKKEIAEVLGISPITVATYLGRALPKLGAASEEHAVRITFETGIFKMPEDRA